MRSRLLQRWYASANLLRKPVLPVCGWMEVQFENIPAELFPLILEQARKAAAEVKADKYRMECATRLYNAYRMFKAEFDAKESGVERTIKRMAAGLLVASYAFAHFVDTVSWWF